MHIALSGCLRSIRTYGWPNRVGREVRPVTRTVVVFGGTGFLGRRIVQHLLDPQFAVRIASRHPERGKKAFPDGTPPLESVRADIGEDASINAAVADTFGLVNATSLSLQSHHQT